MAGRRSDRAQTTDPQGGPLRACLGVCVAIAAVGSAAPAGAQAPPAVFSASGAEQAYVVPAGVSLVSIAANGAPGGGGCGGGAGGLGARVTGTLAVSAGSVLWVEVGAIGSPGVLPGGFCAGSATPGVFNGGGALGVVGAGGGGGASDVRMVPGAQAGSLGSRLLVAAGGGGAGSGGSVPGGAGGNAGSGGGGARPGGSADLTGPGAGGTADAFCAPDAPPGVFGSGGAGANDFPDNGGGGGGGGYWGGGGGGCEGGSGSGGGGGASYVAPQVGDASAVTTTNAPPSVTITPVAAPSPPQGPPGPAGAQGLTGQQGGSGPAGPARPLVVSILDARLRARPGARVTLRYLATASAAVVVAVRRGRRTVTRISGRAKPGTNRLKLRVPRARARYTVALTARATGGTATDRVRLAVRRPRR